MRLSGLEFREEHPGESCLRFQGFKDKVQGCGCSDQGVDVPCKEWLSRENAILLCFGSCGPSYDVPLV